MKQDGHVFGVGNDFPHQILTHTFSTYSRDLRYFATFRGGHRRGLLVLSYIDEHRGLLAGGNLDGGLLPIAPVLRYCPLALWLSSAACGDIVCPGIAPVRIEAFFRRGSSYKFSTWFTIKIGRAALFFLCRFPSDPTVASLHW